jgi:hypothetical protein
MSIPVVWLRRRLAAPRPLRAGIIALGATSAAYALCILLLAVGGAKPGPAPWLAIPVDTYFWWEALFIGPVIFFAGIMAAGVLHLAAKAFGGTGTFEATLALLGFAVAISTTATLIPDTVVGLALCAGLVDPAWWADAIARPTPTLAVIWIYLLLYIALFLTTFPAVARVAHGLARGPALLVGWSAFAVYQVFLYVFVR